MVFVLTFHANAYAFAGEVGGWDIRRVRVFTREGALRGISSPAEGAGR
jgi:hypothetical protein